MSYDTAFDFSRDRLFRSRAVQLVSATRTNADGTRSTDSVATLYSSPTTVTLTYTAVSQSFSFDFQGSTFTYLPGDSTATGSDVRRYTKALTDQLELVIPRAGFRYVASGRHTTHGSSDLDRYFAFGAATLDTDRPATGSSSYPITLRTSAASEGGGGFFQSSGSLTIDHVTGLVSGTLVATQIGAAPGSTAIVTSLTFAGSVDASTGTMTGTIVDTSQGYSGSFTALFYGPRGVEIGGVFALRRSGFPEVAGALFGLRP